MTVSTPPSIVVVLGNRPQFVKHAALARAWSDRTEAARQVIVDTGQHYDHALAGIFVDELAIPVPDYSLGIGSASHAEQLARMLPPLEEILLRERPASVVLYGDTNSTLGGALVASKLHVPIAHVEAGLRSFDMTMPEEVNRVLTDHVSSMLFAPTDGAVANLAAEGITGERVHRSGDVMADIALHVAGAADQRLETIARTLARHGITLPDAGDYGVVTVHRASNTEPDALRAVIACLTSAARELPLVFPLHPRTKAAAEHAGLHLDLASIENLTLLPPLGYVDMTALVRGARVVLTDSGGLQKEAYVHGVPCVTLRDRTEWTETVDAGWNIIVGIDADATARALASHLSTFGESPWDRERPDLYGDGHAAEQILDVLVRHASAGVPFGLG
ncbi:MAG: UDP-2,3-diacetamido-2,3-dideoxy-D-glucuronate 2-epimerase [Thermoleophilia bacterium]|nr:UDP-2,3-diacetamido-2,3-dideoxy-D-glucuronate 2-epimerase [Thermoleophilia bacterium]